MDSSYWHDQRGDKILFPDMMWSRPENKKQAGKLLIIGGNLHGFASVGDAYAAAEKTGIGTARVLLPDSLQKIVGKAFQAGEYAPSTPSGSFAKKALAEVLAMSQWADGVLLAGDFGRNSETSILIEQCVAKNSGQMTLAADAIDFFISSPNELLSRPDTLLVLSFGQLQKLASSAHFDKAFTSDLDFLRLLECLHDFSRQHQACLIVNHLQNVLVAAGGQVSSTKSNKIEKNWSVLTASSAAVWWLQNPLKAFEALTTSVI